MTGGTTPCGDDAPVRAPHSTRLGFAHRPIFRVTTSDACAQSCAVSPDCCSEVPLIFDLDQPTGQLGGSTFGLAMTVVTPLSWLDRASAVCGTPALPA
jgi:hypothetical protein